jgi:hypothetical protein
LRSSKCGRGQPNGGSQQDRFGGKLAAGHRSRRGTSEAGLTNRGGSMLNGVAADSLPDEPPCILRPRN